MEMRHLRHENQWQASLPPRRYGQKRELLAIGPHRWACAAGLAWGVALFDAGYGNSGELAQIGLWTSIDISSAYNILLLAFPRPAISYFWHCDFPVF